MSWMKRETCPVCGEPGFDPDCEEVDIGVGVMEGNLRGRCRRCGEVFQCVDCGRWLSELGGGACICHGEVGR